MAARAELNRLEESDVSTLLGSGTLEFGAVADADDSLIGVKGLSR